MFILVVAVLAVFGVVVVVLVVIVAVVVVVVVAVFYRPMLALSFRHLWARWVPSVARRLDDAWKGRIVADTGSHYKVPEKLLTRTQNTVSKLKLLAIGEKDTDLHGAALASPA